MDFAAPEQLKELLSDGVFLAAANDLGFRAALGQVDGAEFNFDPAGDDQPDQSVLVRVHTASGPRDFSALRMADVYQGQWMWRTEMADGLDIAQLHGTQPAGPEMVAAARALAQGRPVVAANRGNGDNTWQSMVGINFVDRSVPTAQVLMEGLSSGAIDDEYRALMAYATNRSLQPVTQGNDVTLADSTTVTFTEQSTIAAISGGMRVADVVSDAFFIAVEHQLLRDARFPQAKLQLQLPDESAWLTAGQPGSGQPGSGQPGAGVPVRAAVIALATQDTWTWAWADDRLGGPAVQAARAVAACGRERLIPDVVRPRVPVDRAREIHLVQAAMQLCGMWTMVPVQMDESTTAIVLVDAPALRLPAPTAQAVSATLSTAVPEGLDVSRAVAAYARFRGLPCQGAAVQLPDGTVVTAAGHSGRD